jgi:hypothetical protein
MPLSITKVDAFLEKHEMITNNFYVDSKGYCRLIEVYAVDKDETFMIYVSSSCKMSIGKGSNVFRVSEEDFTDNGDIIDRYTGNEYTVEHERLNIYDEDESRDIETRLNDNYTRPVQLENDRNSAFKNTKDIYRQIKRLSPCVSGMNFKFCIHTSDHIYFVDTTNEDIRLFSISSSSRRSMKFRKLSILVSLNTLFDSATTVTRDASTVKKHLIKNIRQNLTKNLNNMTDGRIPQKYTSISNKLTEYNDRRESVLSAITELYTSEKRAIEHKANLTNRDKSAITRFTLNKDIEFAKQTKIVDKRLSEIEDAKKELYLNNVSLIVKRDNLLLMTDSVLYDISVLNDALQRKVSIILDL